MSNLELIDKLQLVLRDSFGFIPEITMLNDKGLAHSHFRLGGTGLLARVPKQSQMDLSPNENLVYEAMCFHRAGPSGHVPRLDKVISPLEGLPWGALIVEEIFGSCVSGPHHLTSIMLALASIHVLPVPKVAEQTPLQAEGDPIGSMLRLVNAQSAYLDHPLISEETRSTLKKRLEILPRTISRACNRLPPRLITFDAHPGNFVITSAGKAMLVDLEKLRYSYPPLDLAHATLNTSTTWDIDASFSLSADEVARAYGVWMRAAGSVAEPYSGSFVPLRELMWLWSVTWCAKWLTQSVNPKNAMGASGEDWSQANSDASLIRHVRLRVNDYLSMSTVNQVLAEFHELERLLDH